MDKSIFEDIKQKSDIVKTVSAFLDVHKKGNKYVAICPFHRDTSPSLSINPQLNIYYCFVCQEGGSPIKFVYKYLGLTRSISWSEAVKRTAEINGIPLPESVLDEVSNKERISLPPESKALDDLASFYRMSLRSKSGLRAMEYLKNRKMTDDVLEHFGIGYAPDDQTLAIRTLREKKGYDVSVLEKAGIISENSSSLTDRYRERIMFPLKDKNGHAVGFSGRKYLPDDPSTSKYINSPETDLFKKSRLLYNLDNALLTVKKDGYLYVTEGFMDVIALYRAGINSAVALMGTNISREHLEIFKSLDVEIRLCLDSDDPGYNATLKWLMPLTSAGIKFKITKRFNVDKEGKDADEYLDLFGAEKLVVKLNDLLDPISFGAYSLSRQSGDFLAYLDKSIAKLSPNYAFLSESEKALLCQRLSTMTGLSEDEFRRRLSPVEKQMQLRNDVSTSTYKKRTGHSTKERLDYQFSLSEMALRKEKAAGNFLEEKNLYTEAQIISRLPLSREAVQEWENSNHRFASHLFELVANCIVDATNNITEDQEITPEKILSDAEDEMISHIEERETSGTKTIISSNEVSELFSNFRLQKKDFNSKSFEELMKNQNEEYETWRQSKKSDELEKIQILTNKKKSSIIIKSSGKRGNRGNNGQNKKNDG